MLVVPPLTINILQFTIYIGGMFTIPSHSVMGGLPTFFINHHGAKCSQVAGDSLAGDAPLFPRPPPLDRAPRSGRSAARRLGPGDRKIWVEIFVPSV